LSHDYHEPAAVRHAPAKARHWAWNIGFAALFMVVGGAVALLGQRLVSGPSTEMSVKAYQDWRVVCMPPNDKGEGGGCTLSAQIAREDGGTLVSFSISDTAPGSQMTVIVPHGVMLEPGLGFSIGDGALRVLPYETCVPQGCMVLIGLDSETLKSLRAAANGSIVVVPGNGSPITIPFSLKGFSEGFDALDDAKASRESIWNIF
jgi:invasion protein IalB